MLQPPSNPTAIQARYLLLQGSTPVFADPQGQHHLDKLWAIDAREHVKHLAHFSIASPLARSPANAAPMEAIDGDPLLSAIDFVLLPHARSRLKAVFQLPRTIVQLWRAIGRADVVHVGIAGWPYPLGWLGAPIARARGKRVIVVVESAPWRKGAGVVASRWARLQAQAYERLGRKIVRASDLCFFTTEQYRQSLGGAQGAREHVVEATWIPEDQIIPDAVLHDILSERAAGPARHLRIAFFGRLTAEKGVNFLVQAMRSQPDDAAISLDIYGDGPELPTLQQELAAIPVPGRVRLCGTLSYGPEFFTRLREYDYVIVPSFGDEQPRIVYDAFSQGVPVLASDTSGLRQCVSEGTTGFFFGVADAPSLHRALEELSSEPRRRDRGQMAARCIRVARSMTHAAMHRRRAELIADFLRE